MRSRAILLTATMLLVSVGAANAFNPQPDPPGRQVDIYEPPDPCLQSGTNMQIRKSGGTQMNIRNARGCTPRNTRLDPYKNYSPGQHKLNPQPLPPE